MALLAYGLTKVHAPPGGSSQNWYSGVPVQVADVVRVIVVPGSWGDAGPAPSVGVTQLASRNVIRCCVS